jgi:hypothetical protein
MARVKNAVAGGGIPAEEEAASTSSAAADNTRNLDGKKLQCKTCQPDASVGGI